MRLISKGLLELYKKIDKYQVLFPHGIEKQIEVNGIKLRVNKLDNGGMAYETQYEETVNVLYRLIAKKFKPEVILDIGANYGFISLVIAQHLPYATYITIEPNKRVFSYLKTNMKELRGVDENAICGCQNGLSDFHINPIDSQDCRVIGQKGWRSQSVRELTIDYYSEWLTKPIFIKIDVQGYEEKVLQGGKKFLESGKWLMKMEYAPAWLEWHGTDYKQFLTELIDKYDVAELNILPYNIVSLEDIFQHKLHLSYIDGFLEHIMKVKKNNTGWRDLLIRPKK